MTLTLLECPDLIGVPMTAEVATSDGFFIHTVDGLALFDEYQRLKEVAVCLTDKDGRETYRVLHPHCELALRVLRCALWNEGNGGYTRQKLEEVLAPEPKRQPSLQQEFGTYGRRT